jgi:hypothetical protein
MKKRTIDHTDNIAPPTKKQKLDILQQMPKDILIYHIIPPIALDWLYVSKEWSEVAFWNLTRDSRVSFTKESICQAARMGCTRIVELHLYNTNFKAEYVQAALVEACTHGRHNIAALLLKDFRIDSMKTYAALVHCSVDPNVIRVLLEYPRIDPSEFGNKWLMHAVGKGWTDIIKLLLADGRVDPRDIDDRGDYHDNSFDIAVEHGDCTIIELLLGSPIIDPIFYAGYTLLSAMKIRPEYVNSAKRIDCAEQLITTRTITKIYRKHLIEAMELSRNSNKMIALLNTLQIEE